MRNILIRSIRYWVPCYITSSHFNDCLGIEPLKLLLLEAKLGFSAARWWYFLWGEYPGLMLKIEMVLKSFTSGLPWRKHRRAPTWLSKTGLFQCLASRQPVQLPGGFMVCSILCKGLGETAQFAAFLWPVACLKLVFQEWKLCEQRHPAASCLSAICDAEHATAAKAVAVKPSEKKPEGKTFWIAGISQPWLWVGSLWIQITCSPIWILFLDMNSHLLPGSGIPSRALHS